MSELIRVNFKEGIVIDRRDLEAPVPEWNAKKDPEFKDWVAGIAMLAEAANKFGGNWRRMAIVMADNPPGKESFCMTMWDNSQIPREDVVEAMHLAIEKVTKEPEDVEVLDMTTQPPTEGEPDDQ